MSVQKIDSSENLDLKLKKETKEAEERKKNYPYNYLKRILGKSPEELDKQIKEWKKVKEKAWKIPLEAIEKIIPIEPYDHDPYNRKVIIVRGRKFPTSYKIGGTIYRLTEKETLQRGKWAMCKIIYFNSIRVGTGEMQLRHLKKGIEEAVKLEHREKIRKALEERRRVPENVLKDYPNLKRLEEQLDFNKGWKKQTLEGLEKIAKQCSSAEEFEKKVRTPDKKDLIYGPIYIFGKEEYRLRKFRVSKKFDDKWGVLRIAYYGQKNNSVEREKAPAWFAPPIHTSQKGALDALFKSLGIEDLKDYWRKVNRKE
ncbi:MAG: hypothetical protein Q6362_000170 [Candidatus Wukongarchaeota archaeon]|nr:hypothetical protein [Candidatus Wukongarchaeota archaeon]